METSAIQTDGLVKSFGEVLALDGLDLNVAPGVVYGFLGPNGAGKTTTLRILSGLANSDRGSANVLGNPVRLHDPAQQVQIGVLPEEAVFYRWMTAREYLCDFVAPLHGITGEVAARRTSEMLEMVGLKYAADRRAGGFSRGMRQRLGLAQAMIHKPPVLLLDEPVSALDPSGRKDVLEMIDGLRGETTVLLSTHILADVERVCDVIGIIDHGRMLVEDSRAALLERYAAPVFEVEIERDANNWIEQITGDPHVEQMKLEDDTVRLWVNHEETAQRALLQSLTDADVLVRRFEKVTPSLEDIFLRLTNATEKVSQHKGGT
ncbi:MAG: ABC transporter ATP-binding protein [Chloroflexota bacterium]|nr:ABC transporter ATP-binding protein [Chloroflexota bacterium]